MSAGPTDFKPSALTRAYVAFSIKHRVLLLAIALLLAIPATWRTVWLYSHLRTEVEELLPRESPSVKAFDELRARIPGLLFLGVVADYGDEKNRDAALKLLDDLAERIGRYPPELARRVRLGDGEERAFLDKHAALYLDLPDLHTIRDRIEERHDWEVGKAMGTLLDPDEPAPPIDFGDLEKKYRDKIRVADREGSGRFVNPREHTSLLLVEVGEFSTGQGHAAELLSRVKSDLAALGGPEHYAPGMRVGYTGDVAISVEETAALMDDLSISSLLVMLAVVGVLVFYYRWWRSVLVLVPPLLLATVFTFAVASLPPFSIDALNSNTAFLGSIIVGNGINFGIILLARYVEARRRGEGVELSLGEAMMGARAGTLAAALAAGVSYASLGITEFRGFRQFGYIGGIGMALSWLLAYVLMPPLCSLLDRDERTAPRPVKSTHGHGFGVMDPIARGVLRFAPAIAIVGAVLTVAAVAKVRSFSSREIEYDLSRLRRADTWRTGEGYWGRKMDRLLGRTLTPSVVLCDSVDDARAVKAKIVEEAKRPPLSELVTQVLSFDDLMPASQPDKLEVLAEIRKLMTPRVREAVPEDKRDLVERLLATDYTGVTEDELPSTFTSGMRERDGSIGRTVLVYPNGPQWDGPKIVKLVRALRDVTAAATPKDKPGRAAGPLMLTSDIFQSLGRDGPLATGLAFLGVTIVVLALFRWSSTSLAVLASLFVGVLWLAALQMLLGVKLNFANFIAYPITFGIGVDYAVNVMSRYVQDGSRDVAAAVRSTGGAVVLCSATTIIGYSSLLLAQNRALFLFGLLSVLGELACLATAVVFLPSVLVALERRARRKSEEPKAREAAGG